MAQAEPDEELVAKKLTRRTPEGNELQSFRTLLAALATQCRNTCEFSKGASVRYTKITDPDSLQREAFKLLDEACSQLL